MEKKIPILYDRKEDCCGCEACRNVCPQRAITMVEDEDGFFYPHIDESLCIMCQKCKKVCSFQNKEKEKNNPINVYAAVSKNKEQLQHSASGGIFAAIAEDCIKRGGTVFGAVFNDDFSVVHEGIDSLQSLVKLQNSKYVQSRIDGIFSRVATILKKGEMVVFSGTPCQIAGLKSYLGKEYQNLFTVDIICHGVPSIKIFKTYMYYFESKYKGKIKSFTFRDKQIGWGENGRAIFEKYNGRLKNKILWQSSSSYMYYFLKGLISRKSCYHCKYAGLNRPGDITIGDYWGIEKQHPEYLLSASGWDEKKGISVVIVNTERGGKYIENLKNIEIKNSTFEKAAYGNDQLQHPCSNGKRDEAFLLLKEKGWSGLESNFKKVAGIKKYSSIIKYLIPSKIKIWIKRTCM